MRDRGVLTLTAAKDQWMFRRECFDGAKCDIAAYTPLVNESMRLHQPDVFHEFLATSHRDAEVAAVQSGVGVSSLLASLGYGLGDQVRALRYRSIVVAILMNGWKAVRVCLDHGITAEDIFRDPVFRVTHPGVVRCAARTVVQDSVPWRRDLARLRLMLFFGGECLREVFDVLVESADPHLQLFLLDAVAPPDPWPGSATRLVIAAWRLRRAQFPDVCTRAGLTHAHGLFLVYESGDDDALDCIVTLPGGDPDVRDIRWRTFECAWKSGDTRATRALADVMEDGEVDGRGAGAVAALRMCKRMSGLESIVKQLLVEKMMVRPTGARAGACAGRGAGGAPQVYV
eukprot:jgi/Tetstr1/454079/TSEL_040998.t1